MGWLVAVGYALFVHRARHGHDDARDAQTHPSAHFPHMMLVTMKLTASADEAGLDARCSSAPNP